MNFDVIIIGGGAAGLMCAIEAGKRGRKVRVLEHNDVVGKKIRISGGGRCNFTNRHTTPDRFLSENPGFHKSALSRYTAADFIDLVRKHRIAFHEKKLGQLFCDGASQEIINMLLRENNAAGVDIVTGCSVSEVRKPHRFVLATNKGEMVSESLVIATGGLSLPKIGASDFGYRVAQQFGVRSTELRAALVPLTFSGVEGTAFRELTGISVDATVSLRRERFRENVLFTHRGLSGPAVLQISSYWEPGDVVALDLLPDMKDDAGLSPQTLSQFVPNRLAQKFCDLHAPIRPGVHYTRKEIDEFRRRVHEWKLIPNGTEGYAKAEVTAGGIDTDELSSKTMECRRVSGLYFIGEVVDVTGQLGGFNFQWAWSSGFVAGQYV